MATATGMPWSASPGLCVGEIPASSTLGGSTPTSNLQRGQNWICSASGCTSTRRGGGLLGHGRVLRLLGAWCPFSLINISNLIVWIDSDFTSMKEGWTAAIGATSREEFFATAREADPRSYVCMYEKLEYYADKHYTPPVLPFTPEHTEFVRVPEEMRNWVANELPKVRNHNIDIVCQLLIVWLLDFAP